MEGIINRFSQIANRRAREAQALPVSAPDRRTELLEALRQTAGELEAVRSRFDLETDFDLVEACILEINSLERRYGHLLKEARAEQIMAY